MLKKIKRNKLKRNTEKLQNREKKERTKIKTKAQIRLSIN